MYPAELTIASNWSTISTRRNYPSSSQQCMWLCSS